MACCGRRRNMARLTLKVKQDAEQEYMYGGGGGLRNGAFKCVMLGESAVGKSSLVTRLVDDEFNEAVESTLGSAFHEHKMTLCDGNRVTVEIWDTAGQERFRALAPMYYRGARAALCVYDVTNRETFVQAQEWVREVLASEPHVILALVANKCDLSERGISSEDLKQFMEEYTCLHMETSAKTGTNVNELFLEIAHRVVGTAGGQER